MNKCYNDVKAFMLLGQPDRVARELRVPAILPAPFFPAPIDVVSFAIQMVEDSRNIRATPTPSVTNLGIGLMLEELGETIQAAEQGNLEEFADGLADLIYVATWTALAHGIDLPAVWSEVQRSNMEKFPECGACGGLGFVGPGYNGPTCPTCSGLGRVVIRDASGKVQKPSGWTAPDIKGVLARSK